MCFFSFDLLICNDEDITLKVSVCHHRYLRQLRSNRDEENKLMKNVPGWETGKLFGEPVFHNLNNRFPVVHPEAYYAHNSWDEMFDRYYKRQTY